MKRRPLRILLCDPQDGTRRSIRQALETTGDLVEAVTTGRDVVLVCELDPPDVLIMELSLPDRDGFELVQQVRHETRDRELTIVLMTQPNDEMTRTYLGAMVDFAGGDYYLAKPCDPELLLSLLDELRTGTRDATDRPYAGSPTHMVWPTSRARSQGRSYPTEQPVIQRGFRHPDPAPMPRSGQPSPATMPATTPHRRRRPVSVV